MEIVPTRLEGEITFSLTSDEEIDDFIGKIKLAGLGRPLIYPIDGAPLIRVLKYGFYAGGLVKVEAIAVGSILDALVQAERAVLFTQLKDRGPILTSFDQLKQWVLDKLEKKEADVG